MVSYPKNSDVDCSNYVDVAYFLVKSSTGYNSSRIIEGLT